MSKSTLGFQLGGLLASAVALLSPTVVSAAGPYSFYAIAPCRAIDTRPGAGNLGPYNTPMPNGVVRTFTIKAASPCFVPSDAAAVAFNVTVADTANSGFVALYPVGAPYPGVSTINFIAGENLANGAIVPVAAGAGADLQAVAAFEPGPSGTNMILDITGYFK